MRIVGLPVHLWEFEILEQVGGACGGFLDVDTKTKALATLQWARILVCFDGGELP